MDEKPKLKILDSLLLVLSVVLNMMLLLILFSLKMNDSKNNSIWRAAFFYSNGNPIQYFCTGFIVAFFVGIVLSILSVVFLFIKKRKLFFHISIPYHLILSLVILCSHFYYKVFSVGALICIIASIILLTSILIYSTHRSIELHTVSEEKDDLKKLKIYKRCLFIFESIAVVLMFSIFFIPLYSYTKIEIIEQIIFNTTYTE